jgi:hypothetical protein
MIIFGQVESMTSTAVFYCFAPPKHFPLFIHANLISSKAILFAVSK